MNKLQEKAISGFRSDVQRYCRDRYEIKRWEIDEIGVNGILSLVVVVGLPGDEGTMAAIFARDHAHIFIGPRGGITYPVFRKRHQIERPLNGRGFLHVVVEQNKDGRD